VLNSIKNKGLQIKTNKKHNFTLDLEITLVYFESLQTREKQFFVSLH